MNNNELNSLREALKVSPDNIPLQKLFARMCLDNWALGEGREVYERILVRLPEDRDARLGIAQILFQMGKASEASVRIDALLKEFPDDVEVLLCASRIKISEGDLNAAVNHYEKVLSRSPASKDGAIEQELRSRGFLRDVPAGSSEGRPANANLQTSFSGDIAGSATPAADQPAKDVERPKIVFADVGGMESIKEEIRLKIIYPARNPQIYQAYGKKAGGGVLLYGPPGCGKTLVSRATAGEIGSSFLSLGLHQILDMYIGNSEKNLHEVFELARQNAPSVLFIDEIDALAANRTDLRHSASRTLINQFLAEMDGDINSNEGVLVIGATNAPWYIDPAFRRPGRFDRIIFVPTPDEVARVEILRVLVKGRPVENLDINAVAKKTKDFSGADLKALFDLATENSLARAMKENRVIPITTNDLLEQAKKVVPSSRAWFESARNYALYSNQSGLYDPILSFLGIKK